MLGRQPRAAQAIQTQLDWDERKKEFDMSMEKKPSLYVSYQPMAKEPGQSLTHYTCASAKRGYLTLRRRQAETVQKPLTDKKG